MDKNRLLACLAMLVTVVIWGVAGPVIKVTLRDIQPLTFLALRFFVNTIIISPLLFLYLRRSKIRASDQSADSSPASLTPGVKSSETPGVSPAGEEAGFPIVRVSDLPRLFLLTLLGTTATLALIFLGIDRTTALDATLIIATAPIFIVIGGSLVCIKGIVCLRETVTRLEKIGLLVALTGIGITVLQPLLEHGFGRLTTGGVFVQENLYGNLLILASNITWAAFTLLAKEDFRRFTPFLITAFSFIFGFLTFLPLAFLENPNFLITIYHLPFTALLGVLYMSLLSSIVAYFTYAWGVSKIEASEAALFLYLEPIFAAPFAYLWLGEKITSTFLLGAAVIAAGVVITEYQPRRVPTGTRPRQSQT